MLKALVTGATGFIGQYLCSRLQAQGYEVIAIGRRRCEGPWQQFIELDFEKLEGPIELPRVDEVYHLASKAHILDGSEPAEEEFARIAVEGQAYLLEHLQEPEQTRYLLCSTVKAMGETTSGESPLDESSPARPTTPYGRAKLRAERALWESSIPLKSRTVVRPVAVYGKGQRGNLDRMTEAIRRGRFPPLPRLNNRRSFVHVEDLVDAMILAQRTESIPDDAKRLFVACEERPVSTTDLYEAICEQTGRKAPKWRIPHVCLRVLACAGDCGQKVVRRTLPFNTAQLQKLTASAWYDPVQLRAAGFQAKHFVLDDLRKGLVG